MAATKATLCSSPPKDKPASENELSNASSQGSTDPPAVKSSAGVFKTHFALVGNKTDLQHMVAVKPQTHENFAATNAMSSHLVSASRADGVELMIKKVSFSSV